MELLLFVHCVPRQAIVLDGILRSVGVAVNLYGKQVMLSTSVLAPAPFDDEALDEISQVWKVAREFISRINGALLITVNGWLPISLVNIRVRLPDGGSQWLPISASGELESGLVSIAATVKVGSGSPRATPDTVRHAHPAALILSLSNEDPAVAKVLRLREREANWVNLYRMLELILKDIGARELVALGWATAQEIRAFKASANNSSVSGDESRHGTLPNGLSQDELSLRSARRLVHRVTTQWLNYKQLKR